MEATSLDDVALAVGVRKQTVLYWFRSKDALVSGVVEAAVDELGRSLDAAVAGRRPGHDVVVAVVDEVLRLGARRPDLLVLLREVTRLGPSATATLGEAIAPR
ncbi:MAG TPA: TetR/AcrR family transcriptional regulator, partial [Iamia sp.]|nr:TetR/AcrR family transcriptional regulator [Iamia sp.]